jgi:hypothetical protein
LLVLNNADVMLTVPIGNFGVACIKDAGRRLLPGRQTGLADLSHVSLGHDIKPAEVADHDGSIIDLGLFASCGSELISCPDSEPERGSAWGSSFAKT